MRCLSDTCVSQKAARFEHFFSVAEVLLGLIQKTAKFEHLFVVARLHGQCCAIIGYFVKV